MRNPLDYLLITLGLAALYRSLGKMLKWRTKG